jgi:hypothetical protein
MPVSSSMRHDSRYQENIRNEGNVLGFLLHVYLSQTLPWQQSSFLVHVRPFGWHFGKHVLTYGGYGDGLYLQT